MSDECGLHRYGDALSLPDPDPLAAYVLSARGGGDLPAGKIDRLHRRIAETIADAGAFHITKSVGLFTAGLPQ